MNMICQVVYRPQVHPSQSHHPPEFVVLVEHGAYQKWQADPQSVPLFDVLAGSKDPISVMTHGHSGLRSKPSKQELSDHLGSEDPFQAALFVLSHGKLGKHQEMKTSNMDFFNSN